MSKNYLLRPDGSFLIKDYNRIEPFSSFLPGISGEWGIPLWVFYVNRAQGVIGFGIKDKNHAISEFFPANKAYSFVSTLGFRTFLKINQKIYHEPFRIIANHKREEQMLIRGESLEIKEDNPQLGLNISVKYFTLPNTPVAGLVRAVTIKNTSKRSINLEGLDGLSRIIPFGSNNFLLKNMSHTLQAWMHSLLEENLALFRLLVDPGDGSRTKYIEGANYNYSFYEDRRRKISPQIIIDPGLIFGHDMSYSLPVNFTGKNFKLPRQQIDCGKTPCSFTYFKWSLPANQERTLYSIFGASFKADMIKRFIKDLDADFLIKKDQENTSLIKAVKSNAYCLSALKEFDSYVQQTYLDNVLRGGYPYCSGSFDSGIHDARKGTYPGKSQEHNEAYYIFSRKHGDLERDYNHFHLLPSYFSEGEANYRDINQNRRMDLFFEPSLKNKNVVYFLNFIKIDGYNPLTIQGEKLFFPENQAQILLREFGIKDQRLLEMMIDGFYLGDFFKLMEEERIELSRKKDLMSALLKKSGRIPQALHGEGYWIDHWHYNLDLIESFLYFYPDEHKELFLDKEFIFWDDAYRVKERSRRYVLRSGKVYQGESIELNKEKESAISQREGFKNALRTRKGEIYKTNLISKLLVLILNKASTLDPEGIGIEMEADKPGWCDSLNGLPALFGSSLCETLELKRAANILFKAVRKLREEQQREIFLANDIFVFFKRLNNILRNHLSSEAQNRDYLWWDQTNSLKEEFRAKTKDHISPDEKKLPLANLEQFLRDLMLKLDIGIKKAEDKQTGLPLTYFTYEVKNHILKNAQIIPQEFIKKPLPLFLEGIMHTLRLERKKSLHQDLRKSDLFDKVLKMYRLNVSLKEESLEIGRSRVFTPGWLENESIWLHMEYKYLLELLKSGFYEEFFTDFYNCGVCFFKPHTYGRSILENSSFIVSSAYPDKSLWGKGFVARLSGATVELLNIWVILCLGKNPFCLSRSDGFHMRFSPILRKGMFTTSSETIDFNGEKVILPKNIFAFKLFSKTLVVYHNPKRKNTFSPDCLVDKIVITIRDKKITRISDFLGSSDALTIRNKEADRVDVFLA
ncbi:MAG: hypothetical protein NG737_06795 [Omnitrophica bacterium]|nr:hypothetical protein [Candidatus Omnitrophota bacterium]